MNFGQGGDPPSGPREKSAGMLSNMLGRGLAETLVLELVDFGFPTAMEKVVVTEPLSEVFVGLDDSVDSGSSDSSCRFCTPRL